MNFFEEYEKTFEIEDMKKILQIYSDILILRSPSNLSSEHIKTFLEKPNDIFETFSEQVFIKDPLFLLISAMFENNEFEDVVSSFNEKCKNFMVSKNPRIKKTSSSSTISQIVDKYIRHSPKKVTKTIKESDASDLSRHLSFSSVSSGVSSPVLNY